MLEVFKDRKGNCIVPAKYKNDDGFSLGNWVMTQRANREILSSDRIKKLNELGFFWGPIAEAWEGAFSRLQEFKDQKGDCSVPKKYKDDDGFALGHWVGRQRKNTENLFSGRIKKLEDLGFFWDPIAEAWEEVFSRLQEFNRHVKCCLNHGPGITLADPAVSMCCAIRGAPDHGLCALDHGPLVLGS